MKLYFAPMEGVTSSVYRRLHAEMFPGADRYYAPFLAPDGSGNCRSSAMRELLPERNRGLSLVPQILCSRPGPFLIAADRLRELGYEEVNLNVGCPSATVVTKHKGAGMLLDLRTLDAFFEEVFSHCPLRVSVKTRLGLQSTEEFPAVLEIYQRYPISELIIHARDRSGMYQSRPDLPAFAAAWAQSRVPVCYNGDLFSPAALSVVQDAVPGLDRFMLGRGAAANPALPRQLRGGAPLESEELETFLARLCEGMLSAGLSEHHTLVRLKELWYYLIHMFPDSRRGAKDIRKAQDLSDYRAAVRSLFSENSFCAEAAFRG